MVEEDGYLMFIKKIDYANEPKERHPLTYSTTACIYSVAYYIIFNLVWHYRKYRRTYKCI